MPPDARGGLQVFDAASSRLLALGLPLGQMRSPGGGFRCLEGGARLLEFYFLEGKRDVRVGFGGNEGLVARLGTRWVAGRREWTLRW